jgi:hypothetical protein
MMLVEGKTHANGALRSFPPCIFLEEITTRYTHNEIPLMDFPDNQIN